MAETIVLDPSEVATSRTSIDITPWVSSEGIDWGDAEIAAYMADQSRGSSPVDFRVPNRTVTIPLVLKTVGGTTFAQARTKVQAKAAIFQREGGWLKRVSASGSLVFADVVNATLKLGGGWGQAHKNYDTEASLVLEVLPDFYGSEVTLADHTETSAAELVFTEISIQGDFPARCRITVDDDQGATQLGLVWGFRSRHYSSAATAATRFEAEALTPLDTATRTALSGASGGTVVTHGTLATYWTPILNTNIGGTAFLTHTGTNRLFARYRTASGTAAELRAVWDVGDLAIPVENTGVRTNAGTQFYIADLGEVRLDPPPTGAHRWQAQIQGRGDTGAESLSIDKLWVVNVDEGYGRLTAPFTTSFGLSSYVARDEFLQTAGDITGKTASIGGVWTGVGDANDFALNTTIHDIQRTAVSDTALTGRQITLGSSLTATGVQANVFWSVNPASGALFGLLARHVDVNNYLYGAIDTNTAGGRLVLGQVVGGVRTEINSSLVSATLGQVAVNRWLRLLVGVTGKCVLSELISGITVEGFSTSLAVGGTLASGRPGIIDEYTSAEANDRFYDQFLAWVPVTDAVIHPSRSVQIATDGVRRLDTAGSAYGPVSTVTGDLPRLPVAGLEGRTTEVFVKGSRGDLEQIPDIGIDDISGQIVYRPCWLFVP